MNQKSRAIRVHEQGGPEVLRLEEVEVEAPGPGQVLLRQTAAGLNFIDVYHREGLYPVPLPATLGMEAAGKVEAVGPGVEGFQVGDRVAYADVLGAYTTQRLVPAARLLHLPKDIGEEQAAGMMLKGLTAHYLIRRTFPVRSGQTILVHAASGGVGLILCQWAKALGASVIGTVGTPEKAELARSHGCDHPVIYTRQDFVERVREITDGAGVPVVYDGVGASTFEGSLDCLQRRGMLVSYGNASGPVPPFSILQLSRKGSLFLTRPSLMHYIERRDELEANSAELFEAVGSGAVEILIGQRIPLEKAADAHRALEARETTASTILTAC